MRFAASIVFFFSLVLPSWAISVSNSVATATATVSGNQISVYTSMGSPAAGTFERIWVYTQTAAQAAQGTVSNPAYPYGFSSVPVQRFSDSGGTNTSGTVLLSSLGSGSRVYLLIAKFSSSTGAYLSGSSGYLEFPLPSQIATLFPSGGAAAILTGQTFSGQASGAQAGNAYNISIVSGGGGASINSTTGVYTVTAGPTGGLIHYKVWISAGGGYDRSPDAEADIAVSLSKKVTVTIPANNSSYPIKYTLTQGGVVIGTFIQQPGGTAHILQIDVGSNDGPVTMTATISGVKQDGNSIIVGDPLEEVVYVISDEILPDVPTTPAPPPVNDIKKPEDTTSSSVWTPGNQSTDAAQQKDLLTNQVFREGVDKLLAQGNAGSTSESVDLSAAPAATTNVTIAGVNSLKGKLPLAPQLSSVGQSNNVSITLPMITGLTTTQNYTFVWDYSDWVQRLAWLRAFILGCMSVWFFFGINKQLRNSVAN